MAAFVSTESFGRSFTALPAPPAVPLVRVPQFKAGDIRGIVTRTVSSARASGRDYMGQSRAAAAAVLSVRPDLNFGEALETVIRLREMETF